MTNEREVPDDPYQRQIEATCWISAHNKVADDDAASYLHTFDHNRDWAAIMIKAFGVKQFRKDYNHYRHYGERQGCMTWEKIQSVCGQIFMEVEKENKSK